MTTAAIITLGVIIFVIVTQLATKMTTDAVYLTAILILVLTGTLDSTQGFAGLVAPATLLLIFIFVIVECLERTGFLKWIMNQILGKHKNMTTTLLRIMPPATLLSAFISNPSVAQMMYHSVAEWGRKYGILPSKLLLPIAYMIGIGGTCTVIAYPVNMILFQILENQTGEHYSIFTPLWCGLFCSAVCMLAIILLQKLLPECKDPNTSLTKTEEYMVEMLVPTNNNSVGKTIEEIGLDKLGCGHLVSIIHFDREFVSPVTRDHFILGGDRLVFAGNVNELLKLRDKLGFAASTHHIYDLNLEDKLHAKLQQVSLTARSRLIGKKISETDFEECNHVVLAAMCRDGEIVSGLPRDTELRAGDMLLFEGDKLSFKAFNDEMVIHNYSSTGKPDWRGAVAALGMLAVILLPALEVISLLNISFLIALVLVAIHCCKRSEAWNSINWNFIVMMMGAFAIGTAMNSSGLAAYIADIIRGLCGTNPMQTTIVLTLCAMLMTQVLFDATVVPILAPIALESATLMGISPMPLVMAVLLGSACNFTTQISTAHMMMVYPLGGYKLRDLIKFGTPMFLIMSVAIISCVSIFYPLSSTDQDPVCGDETSNIYSNKDYWYDNGREVNDSLADVFYILPTCVFDTTDSTGNVCHYASLTDPEQRSRMLPSYQLADEIFADSANFFAPYYRHISLDTWIEGEKAVDERFPKAMKDVEDAFCYYLKHLNKGRPFVLAGFSQGGKCVVELVKKLDDKTASRLVAAYVCGYRVTSSDIASSKHLKKALRADDTGVTIVYNTVADTSAICNVVSQGNEFIINPASWTTDISSHQLNDSVTVSIDPKHNVLIAKGVDVQAAFVPSLETIFPVGNLHLQELVLYKEQIKENVKTRLRQPIK